MWEPRVDSTSEIQSSLRARDSMLALLQRLLSNYGYAAVAVGVLFEGIGIPLPGETLLLLGSAYAGAGGLHVPWVIAAAALGAMVGDSAGYFIGRKGGRALLLRHGRILHIRPHHMAKAEHFFDRHGDKTVFLARFVAVLRMFAPLLAGAYRMPYRRFVVFNISGGLLWALTFGILGAAFGSQWRLVERWAGRAGLLIVFLVAFVGLAVFTWRWIARHERGLQGRWAELVHSRPVAAFRKRFAPQLAFARARLSPTGYLGLHLTVGVVLIVAGSWLFGAIAEDVLHREPIVDLDNAVAAYLAEHRELPFTIVMRAVSAVGGPGVLITVSLMLAVLLAWRRRWKEFALLVLGAWGAELIDFLLKVIFARQRPSLADPVSILRTYSFPSGHAMESMAFYGLMAYLMVRATRTWAARVGIVIGAIVVVFLIGFSRLYLGVHYLSDVVGGFVGGFVWLVVVVTGVNVVAERMAREHQGGGATGL